MSEQTRAARVWDAARRWPSQEGNIAAYGGPIAAVAIALRLTSGAWGGRATSGDDVMAHLVRTRWGIDHLIWHGRLDGWLPSFAVGYREFLFFGPGFTWALAILRLVTLGQLSNAGALKVVTVASFVAFPLVVTFLARSYGLRRDAAGLAAILALLVNNPFGIGLTAVFGVALVPQQLAAIFACLSLGAVLRMVADPQPRWTVLAAASSAALVVTHLISVFIVAILLVVSLPIVFITDRPRLAVAGQLAWAALATVGLSSFWLIPALAHRNLHGPVTTWSTPPLASRLADIMGGRYLFRPHVAEIVLIAGAFAIARVSLQRRWAAALVLVPAAYVAVSRIAIHRYPGNEIAIQIENRGMGYVGVIALFCIAVTIAWATRAAGPFGELSAVLALAVAVWAGQGSWRHIAAQQPAGAPQLHEAARFLAENLPPMGRFAEVRDFPADVNATGVQHPDFWLGWESGRPALNEFNVESTSASIPAFVPEHLLDHSAADDADTLSRLGVSLVVSTTPAATAHLLASSRLVDVWHDRGFTILRVEPDAGRPDPLTELAAVDGSALTASVVRATAEHLALDVDAPAVTEATLAEAWSPDWHLRVGGHAARLHRSRDGLVEFALPAGPTRVDLHYRPDRWDLLGALGTLVTIGLGGAWARRRLLAGRQGRSARTEADTPAGKLGGP